MNLIINIAFSFFSISHVILGRLHIHLQLFDDLWLLYVTLYLSNEIVSLFVEFPFKYSHLVLCNSSIEAYTFLPHHLNQEELITFNS